MDDSSANLRELLGKIAKENNFSNYDVEIQPISSNGANYTSQLYSATISNDSKELNLFAKVIIMGDKMRSKGLGNIFEVEPFVYTELSKIYLQLEEKHNVPKEHRLEFPKFYAQDPTRGQEVLVLEDLSAQGYNVHDRFQSINWPYACEAVKEMAKLHALSFAFEQEQPEEFEKVQKKFVNPLSNNEQIEALMASAVETAISVIDKNNRSRFQHFIAKIDLQSEVVEYTKPLRRLVLMHGDFKVCNLMHKINDKGIYQLKMLDYQTMRPGSPVADLLYFIITGTDEEFRAKHYLSLIDHYYSELCVAMRRLCLKPNQIYSRDDFDTEVKMKLPYGIIIAACLLPMVLVEEEDAPTMDKDKDIMAFKLNKVGKRYPERINGIINDYIKWKIL